MLWLASWIPTRGLEEELYVCYSLREAKEFVEDVSALSVDWKKIAIFGFDGDEHGWASGPLEYHGSSGSLSGEFILTKESEENVSPAVPRSAPPIHRTVQPDGNDGDQSLLQAAIDHGKHVTFDYVNSKRKRHPGVLRPTGWSRFEHDHDWAGGHTLCVVGYCYRHKEERHFAVKRMSRLRMLDDPVPELLRLGWIESPTVQQAAGRPAVPIKTQPAPQPEPLEDLGIGLTVGQRVCHLAFGNGVVVGVDATKIRIRFRDGVKPISVAYSHLIHVV